MCSSNLSVTNRIDDIIDWENQVKIMFDLQICTLVPKSFDYDLMRLLL